MGLKSLTFVLIVGAAAIFSIFQYQMAKMEEIFALPVAKIIPPVKIAGQDLALPKAEDVKKMPAVATNISAPAGLQSPRIAAEETSRNFELTRQGVIGQTNIQRRSLLGAGHDLVENNLLDIAAQNKVNDMFSRQYFEHASPMGLDSGDIIAAAGYEYIAVGENLAMGDFENDAELVQAWMDSPGHRANILKAGYKEIGAAVGYGMFNGRRTWLAVQEFGTPKTACPIVDDSLSVSIDRAKTSLDNFTKTQNQLGAKIDQERAAANNLEAVNQLNRDISEYNNNIKQAKSLYEDYKKDIGIYNAQVAAFNACITALK